MKKGKLKNRILTVAVAASVAASAAAPVTAQAGVWRLPNGTYSTNGSAINGKEYANPVTIEGKYLHVKTGVWLVTGSGKNKTAISKMNSYKTIALSGNCKFTIRYYDGYEIYGGGRVGKYTWGRRSAYVTKFTLKNHKVTKAVKYVYD